MDKEDTKKKAEELDNSKLLDVHSSSDYPQVKKAVDSLYTEFQALPSFAGKEKIQKKHIKLVILNLYAAYSADPKRYVAYYRMKGMYKGKNRYNKLFISYTTVPVVDKLIELGYVEQDRGFYARTGPGKSRKSRMRAKEKLIDLIINKHHITPLMIGKAPNTECIILRKKDPLTGKQKDFLYKKDTSETIRMRKELYAYNNLLRRTFIDIPFFPAGGVTSRSGSKKVVIDRNDKFVRRIFNNKSWADGGRFYGGWWQRMPKDWRERICIDGSSVVEVDYSGLHIVILYALEGKDYWKDVGKDPYQISGLEESERMRSLLKLVLLTAINCKSKEKAVKAVRYEMNMNKEEYDWVFKEKVDLPDVIEKFAGTHKPIVKYMFSGHGIKLQHIDSTIAEYVINEMTKEEIPVLCIHDSFVVQVKHKEKLLELMEEGFKKAIGPLSTLKEQIDPKVKEISFGKRLFDSVVKSPISPSNKTSVPSVDIDKELIPEVTIDVDNESSQVPSVSQMLEKGDLEYQERFEEHKAMEWEKDYYKEEVT